MATEPEEIEELKPVVRWVFPDRVEFIAFVGKEVLAIVHDIYIVFFNFKTKTENIYVANNKEAGDGVDVICGHRSYLFAFAEKVKNGRIFVCKYPSLRLITQLQDNEVNRYKGLCMMECDLIAAFSGFPNYICTVWNWRTKQRLVCVNTGVVRRKQIFMASRIHMTFCQCWGEGLILWEVGQCYKECLLLRRGKEEAVGWEVSEPPLTDVTFGNDGTLYALNSKASLFSVSSDGIAMVTKAEWVVPSNVSGSKIPHMCAFGNGMLIYGPDRFIRALKKDEEKRIWNVVWSQKIDDTVIRLVGNATCDTAACWTYNGFLYRITGESLDKLTIDLFTFKMRNITKVQLLAPEYKYVCFMNDIGTLAIYDVASAQLAHMSYVQNICTSFQASPADPVLAIFGATTITENYGMAIVSYDPESGLQTRSKMCLTHQIISRIYFSPTGKTILAGAMSAGHIFIIKMDAQYKLTLLRYAEFGRGLADCLLMRVGDSMRCFSIVLFSDKYSIGERVTCINADSGKDNKFAGKMQGPYARLVACATKDTMVGVPHLTRQLHVLKLAGDKGVTVAVKVGAIIDTGHDVKQFDAFFNTSAFITFGYDGTVIVRDPTVPAEYQMKLVMTHRYASMGRGGIREAVIDDKNTYIIQLNGNKAVACTYLNDKDELAQTEVIHEVPEQSIYEKNATTELKVVDAFDKTYLDLQEDNKIREETMDYKLQRNEVVKIFDTLQLKLKALLDENISEVPLHQLPMYEFNLHLEAKKERLKQAEREREIIRLTTEARIRAQDKVTAWIKEKCWDSMRIQRVKLFSLFSHYHVENFGLLPSHRDKWPELEKIIAIRALQVEGPEQFKPWEEIESPEGGSVALQISGDMAQGTTSPRRLSMVALEVEDEEGLGANKELADVPQQESYALSGTITHLFITVPPAVIPQTLVYSYLHMDWMQHITKMNTQNLRIWFNKQFDELMTVKNREVGLVKERNARLRFIVEELNKLSDLRGSFHHLFVEIRDPEWRQEEQTHKLIKVEPEECSIAPYISPSQVVIIPPDPGPKDDFKERALIDMMDGVLEKLWHEEIKKPIPMPQCMLDKDPEHFNEEDLRYVFDYEAKVKFRNEERDKYRKMLHAEYAKLSATLNEGIVKFNQKVKETWLLKVRIDAVIGQENMILFRLRRTNLDRLESAEFTEKNRQRIAEVERELNILSDELDNVQKQNDDCQAHYESLMLKEKTLDRQFKAHFADLSPIIIEQCYKFFKKRPKWYQRATMTPVVLYEMGNAVVTGNRPTNLHADCFDYLKGLDVLDNISNMPAVMDENLWSQVCKLRRIKIDNEIRIRALAQETAYIEYTAQVWARAVQARKQHLLVLHSTIYESRMNKEAAARNRSIQLVLPAGQVEISTSGHFEDFEDATLMPREEIQKINDEILKVGDMKLRMMRKQMEFRKGILSKEWEHAEMKMKLGHMKQELYSYQRLKIPKELQRYLKTKEKGYTDEMDYLRLERAMEAKKKGINQQLSEMIHKVEDLEVKLADVIARTEKIDKFIMKLNVKVSEKRLYEDPLEPIRIRRIFKARMQTLVARSTLVREVQANYSIITQLQTELELLRLKTYPTLASYREIS